MQCLGSVGRWQAVAPWARALRVGGQVALSWRCSLLMRALQPTRPAHACPRTRSSTLTCTARPRTLALLLSNDMFCFICAPCSPARFCQCLLWHFFFTRQNSRPDGDVQEIAADMLHLDGASTIHGRYQSCYQVTIN